MNFIIIFALVNFWSTECSFKGIVEDNDKVVLTEIVSNYLYKYFNNEREVLSIISTLSNFDQAQWHDDLSTNLLSQLKLSNFTYTIQSGIDQSQYTNENVVNLILIDEIASLMNILNNSIIQTFHLQQHLLIVVTQNVQNVSESLNNAFEVLMHFDLLNVNILIKSGNLWSLHYYKPYIKGCHSFEILKIDAFTPENYTNVLTVTYNDLFPPKIFRFNYCKINIATFPLEPNVIIKNGTNGTTEYGGIDVMIVDEICKTLNLIPIYLQPLDGKNRGVIYPNGTATGAMQMVLMGDAHMTVGSYSITAERVALMAYTQSYIQNSFVFAFTQNIIFSTPLWRLMAPFKSCLWISIASLLSISILIILLSRKLSARQRHFIIGGRMNRTPILNMINVMIGSTVSNPRMTHQQYFGVFARTLVILWVFFWVVVRNSYQGSLYGFLQTQRNNSPYDTVEKVRESDAKIHVVGSAAGIIPQIFNSDRFVKHDFAGFVALKKLHNGELDGVIFTNDVTVNYYNMINKSWRQVQHTRDIIRPHNPVFFFRKSSILTWFFNRKIDACNESGLTIYWIAKYRKKPQKINYSKPSKLEIGSIMAILQISAIMYLIAIIVFAMEVFSHKNAYIKKVLDFFTY